MCCVFASCLRMYKCNNNNKINNNYSYIIQVDSLTWWNVNHIHILIHNHIPSTLKHSHIHMHVQGKLAVQLERQLTHPHQFESFELKPNQHKECAFCKYQIYPENQDCKCKVWGNIAMMTARLACHMTVDRSTSHWEEGEAKSYSAYTITDVYFANFCPSQNGKFVIPKFQ